MFLNIYLILSTIMMTWFAFSWSSKAGYNVFIKTLFIGLALYGIIVLCKLVIHV